LKTSGTIPSWQDTLNKLDDIKLPNLFDDDYKIFKASASPKNFGLENNFPILNFGFKKKSLEGSVTTLSFLDIPKIMGPLYGTPEYYVKNPFIYHETLNPSGIIGKPLERIKPIKMLKIDFDSTPFMKKVHEKVFGKWNILDDNYGKVQKLSIDLLHGHETTKPHKLFRPGARSDIVEPIEVIPIGKDYLIDHGVGRSMRAFSKGEDFVYGRVHKERKYFSIGNLKDKSEFHYGDEREWAERDIIDWKDSSPITELERWKILAKISTAHEDESE